MTTLRRDRLDGDIEVLRLDRPDARNALDTASLLALESALGELAADASLRALVLSTTDVRAFCAGADVAEALDAEGGVARMEAFTRVYAAVERFPAPVLCVCVGNVIGAGAEIAAACDLRVGGDNLKLAWPGGRLGVPVGPARLVPLVGLSRAKDLILTGRTIGMAEAYALGLLHRTAAAERAETAALALAGEVAAHPAGGLRRLKALFRELGGADAMLDRENAGLIAWQQGGGRLARGGTPADR